MEGEGEKAVQASDGTSKKRRGRWVPGIPRRRRRGREPWQIQAIKGLTPVAVVLGFLAVGMVLAVLSYGVTASETVATIAGAGGLVMAAFLTPRVVARVLDYFS